MSLDPQLTVVVFSRDEIVPQDLTGFLASFSPDVLPTGSSLAAMMNSFAFTVVDYDEDPREIYEIPEVRAFYAKLWEAWPYWFYFCNLESGEMLGLVSCVVPHEIKVTDVIRRTVGVKYRRPEIERFLTRGFNGLTRMANLAGLTEEQTVERIARVTGFFDRGDPLADFRAAR